MTKGALPLHAADLTTVVRGLSRQLGPASPSHQALMNMAARAAGFRNVQHMRAAQAAARRLARAADAPVPDARAVERALRPFDAEARLTRWPARRAVQDVVLWVSWAALPARRLLTEAEVNARLNARHLFDDPATLRRTMIGAGLLTREPDGTAYRRIERAPPPEARAALRALAARRSRLSTSRSRGR